MYPNQSWPLVLPLWADNPDLGMLREQNRGVHKGWQGHTDLLFKLVPYSNMFNQGRLTIGALITRTFSRGYADIRDIVYRAFVLGFICIIERLRL